MKFIHVVKFIMEQLRFFGTNKCGYQGTERILEPFFMDGEASFVFFHFIHSYTNHVSLLRLYLRLYFPSNHSSIHSSTPSITTTPSAPIIPPTPSKNPPSSPSKILLNLLQNILHLLHQQFLPTP